MQDDQTNNQIDTEPSTQPTPDNEPNVAPTPTAAPTPANQEPANPSLGLIVLGWLCYGFWGWLILALIWAVGVISASFLSVSGGNEIVPYVIAAIFVLLPFAFVTDFFYRKYEPIKKSGGLGVVTIIYSVIFALLGVGALIGTVFVIVAAIVNGNMQVKEVSATLITGFSSVIFYAAAFARTLNPFRSKKVASTYGYAMFVIAMILAILAIVGPGVQQARLKGDKETDKALEETVRNIRSYATSNGSLPESLDNVSSEQTDRTKEIINEGSIKYTVEGTSSFSNNLYERYQLCVVYENESSGPGYSGSYGSSSETYKSSFYAGMPHKKGNVCYKLQAYVNKSSPSYNSPSPQPQLSS